MSEVLLLSRADVEKVLTIDDCIAAVEDAFRSEARPASLSVHVDGGAFHVKAASLGRTFAAKINGNFFDNPARGLPRIQGLIVVSDGENGRPLAILDSIYITILRTGAATAVAAKYLAREDAATLLVCGCGNQGRVSIEAIRRVRPIREVLLFDTDGAKAETLAREVGGRVSDISAKADIVVTCTPSRTPWFGTSRLRPGLFVAAVGADSSEKQEIDATAMAAAKVVVDDLDQCASFGDLRAAIAAGAMSRDDVAATLSEVVRGVKPGRSSDEEVIIFDSTGTALQDVAAAAIVVQRALERGAGMRWVVSG